MRSGRKILSDSLQAQGLRRVFTAAPGFEAGGIATATVSCPDAAAAALMAGAAGALSGKPGLCWLDKGPGACEAASGVHEAMQASAPLVALVTQVPRGFLGREAAGEIDVRLMFGAPIAKWAVMAQKAADIPRLVNECFEAATTGRPGPVVLSLPEDVLDEEAEGFARPPSKGLAFSPRPGDLERLRALLREAARPLVIAGGGGWSDEAIAALAGFCARTGIPAVTGFCRQEVFPNKHECYAGALGPFAGEDTQKAVSEADVVLAVGTRLNDLTTRGYKLVSGQQLIHVYPESSELNRVYKAALAIHSDIPAFLRVLAQLELDGARWQGRAETLHKAEAARLERGRLGLAGRLAKILPHDAVVTAERSFAAFLSGVPFARPARLLLPVSGLDGYALPAALAAKLQHPDRPVLALADEAGFLRRSALLLAAYRDNTPITVIAAGVAPDLAKGFGVETTAVTAADQLAPALSAALDSGKTSVVALAPELKLEPVS